MFPDTENVYRDLTGDLYGCGTTPKRVLINPYYYYQLSDIVDRIFKYEVIIIEDPRIDTYKLEF